MGKLSGRQPLGSWKKPFYGKEPKLSPLSSPSLSWASAAWVASNLRGGAPRHEVHLTVHLSAAALQARVGAWSGPPPAITRIDDGRCSYRTGDESLDWLAVRLGMLGADFEVHEPAALREHLGRLAARYAAAAAGQ